MSSPLLITAADFAPYKTLSINLPAEKLNPFILEAQDFDIKNALGAVFYYDLLTHRTDGPYALLINGESSFTDLLGQTRAFDGLKRALVYFTHARMASLIDIHSTATGFVTKTTEFTTILSAKDRAQLANNSKTLAVESMVDVRLYLDSKKSDTLFTLWRNSEAPKIPSGGIKGVRIGGRKQPDHGSRFDCDLPNIY
jgi:hypothetical protein